MTLILRWVWPSEVGSRSRRYQKTCVFGKNDPLREDYENFVPKGFITSQIHVLCHCVQISWHLADRKSASHALFTGQNNKKIGSLSRSRFSADRAQNLPGQRQTMYSQCPKFHPNRFTSGDVIAERVNTVQTRHKVFPILGEASGSSPSNYTDISIQQLVSLTT